MNVRFFLFVFSFLVCVLFCANNNFVEERKSRDPRAEYKFVKERKTTRSVGWLLKRMRKRPQNPLKLGK